MEHGPWEAKSDLWDQIMWSIPNIPIFSICIHICIYLKEMYFMYAVNIFNFDKFFIIFYTFIILSLKLLM